MLTLMIILVVLSLFPLYNGEKYFAAKREKMGKELRNGEATLAFDKKMERYRKCGNFCGNCFLAAFFIGIVSVVAECTLLCMFIFTNPTILEKKLDKLQIQNVALESSIVEFLAQDAGVNKDELKNEEINLKKTFDYALVYVLRHPELKENEDFAKQFDLYQENYEKIQEYESSLKRHEELRFLLYFGHST